MKGQFKEQTYAFYWKGLPTGETRVANELIPKLSVCISERIMHVLHLSLDHNHY